MEYEHEHSFESVKLRLDEIVEEVSVDDISLDDALGLYEEAIKLGMQVSNLLESDIPPEQVRSRIEAQSEQLVASQLPNESSEAAPSADKPGESDG